MIPPLLTRNVLGNWPEAGPGWLDRLPGLLGEVADEWGLTVGQPYPMTYHWVTEVTTTDGTPAVLKLGVPDGHLDPEAEALRIFDGDGAVRLLAEDRGRGVLLEERAVPGTRVRDDGVLLEVGRRLHRVPPEGCGLPHLRTYGQGFVDYLRRYPGEGPMERTLVVRAAGLFEELCASSPGDVVLHGDLHHDNVLRHGDRHVAIDPHGLIGDPGFEAGVIFYNPDIDNRDPELVRRVPERLDRAGGDDRLVAWAYVMAVLSSVWDVEATGRADTRAHDVARLLARR